MNMTDAPPSVDEALQEFHELLRVCSLDRPPPRQLPVRYQICRMVLMGSEMKQHLPGFVRQCVSSLKFREFIHLYDHDPKVRAEFIELSMKRGWGELNKAVSARPIGSDLVRGRWSADAQPDSAPSSNLMRKRPTDDFMADPDELTDGS